VIAILLLLERARAYFERVTAERALIEPLPDAAWAPTRPANHVWVLFYLPAPAPALSRLEQQGIWFWKEK